MREDRNQSIQSLNLRKNVPEKLKSKINRIQILLQDLENFIKKNGFDPPEANVPLKNEDKIDFPKGYIRKKRSFIKNYKLWKLIDDVNLRNNIAYSLQATDIFNYFINRFNIKLSAGTIFRKMSIVLTFSIAEAIVVGSYKTLRKFCINCPYSSKCKFYLLSLNNKELKGKGLPRLLHELENKGIIDSEIKNIMLELKKVRDRVHIHNAKFNEYLNKEEYSLDTYNKSILLLHYFKINYPQNIWKFESKRRRFCANIHRRRK